MNRVHIQSVASPYDDPQVAPLAASALSRAEAMGLCSSAVGRLDSGAMDALEARLAEAGIARLVQRPAGSDPAETAGWLRALHEALVGSPVPRTEWPALSRSLGLDLLCRLLGISHSSARRYLSAARKTPDNIAARLHFLALVAGDLAGAYNEIGVRRWFDRRRSALGGKTPAEVLTGDWSAEDDGPERVRELAGALGFSPAT
ncbi:MAG: hypothetical protein F4228_05520 [Acidobacteria bacterium]|nr:hypothetical protein [Acidobacteriota bacterium]MYF14145.1 hypothetical protein [Acidobacteriota bacterium]MYI96954.1 hypothetical protein [Acidobacteriota bacterium]